MGEKKKIYASMVDGATAGHSDKDLLTYITDRRPDASEKKIVRAAMLAMEDPGLVDRNVLNTILALAVKTKLGDFHHKQAKPRKALNKSAETGAPASP